MTDLDNGAGHDEGSTIRPSKTAVLTIEDDASVAELLCNVLGHDGCTVAVALNGMSGLKATDSQEFDLIILDICLPDLDGWEVCRRLRNSPRTQFVPLLMLTAEGSEADRVLGLELGADDYVSKPFSPRELRARIRALLRRARARSKIDRRIQYGELSIDIDRREVTYGGRIIPLTPTEFLLVQLLAATPGRILSRSEISSLLREGDSAALDRGIDAHIKSIRKRLGNGADEIETVRGFGYRLRALANPQ